MTCDDITHDMMHGVPRCYPLDGKALCSKCHVKKLHTVVLGKKAVSFQH